MPLDTERVFDFDLSTHQYVHFYVHEDGRIELSLCAGPEQRDVYQRDVSGESSLEIPAERAGEFLVALQAWIEQL